MFYMFIGHFFRQNDVLEPQIIYVTDYGLSVLVRLKQNNKFWYH